MTINPETVRILHGHREISSVRSLDAPALMVRLLGQMDPFQTEGPWPLALVGSAIAAWEAPPCWRVG